MTMPDVTTSRAHTGLAEVLMPVDLSPLGWRMFTLAGRVSAVFDVPRRILHVDTASPWRTEGSSKHRAVPAPNGMRVDVEVIAARTPVDGILRAVADDESALVAMSTHGHTGAAELALGSTTEELLRRWRGSMLLAGPKYQISPVPFSRIVLCVDPSGRTSETLLRDVQTWATRFDVAVQVLTVQEQSPYAELDLILDGNDRLDAIVEAVCTDDRTARLVRLSSSRPAVDIVKYVDATPGTLVAMATHASPPAARMLLGSTAMAVVRHTSSPVLMRRLGT